MSKTTSRKTGPRTLKLALDNSGRTVDVEWEVEDADGNTERLWDVYSLSLETLNACSSAVREKLEDLEASDWSEEAFNHRVPILQDLAKAGADLYDALLSGDPRDRISMRTAKAFRAWFEETVLTADPEIWRIQVVHQEYDAPVVPWGLVFTPLKDGAITDLGYDAEDYSNFWAMSFKLACRGLRRKDADRKYALMNERDARIALTIKVEQDVVKHFSKSPYTKKDFDERVSSTVETFEKVPRESSNHHIFWYVFLNEEGTGYHLNGQEIDIPLFNRVKEMNKNIMIMFFDGNAVIRGDRGAKWVKAVLELGRMGVIAAETDISNPQLRHFGWAFWKVILSSKRPLIEAIDASRREHWPKSLLYGVYCDPLNIYFDPPPESEIAKADKFLTFVMDEMDDKDGSRDR